MTQRGVRTLKLEVEDWVVMEIVAVEKGVDLVQMV